MLTAGYYSLTDWSRQSSPTLICPQVFGARSGKVMAAPLLDLVCFGSECVTWADAYARGRRGWVESLPSMVTDTNAVCRIQGQLLCSDIAPGAVCAPSGKQRCSDLLELRPDFDASLRQTSQYSGLRPASSLGSELKDGSPRSACDPRLGRNRGSVLSVHLAWPPPKPPASALLRVALRFVTASHKHRMNWVPVLLQEVAAQGVPRRLAGVPCSSARLEDGAIFRSFFTGERQATQLEHAGPWTRHGRMLSKAEVRRHATQAQMGGRWAGVGPSSSSVHSMERASRRPPSSSSASAGGAFLSRHSRNRLGRC